MARVMILGGGFGGLAAAHELRRSLDSSHEITVVDQRERFHVGFAKLWDLTGVRSLDDGSRSRQKLNDKGIQFLQKEILAIDLAAKTVTTADGDQSADFLILALGATYSDPHIGLLREAGHNLYDPQALPAIREALEQIRQGKIIVAILGLPYKCPPAPYEATFMIDELLRKTGRRPGVGLEVFTPQPSPLPIAGPEASKKIADTLRDRDVSLNAEHKIALDGSGPGLLAFDNGARAEFDLLLGVPAHVAPKLFADAGLLGASGWIEPDRASLRTSFDGVYAVGDCTAVPIATGQLPKAGVFAEAEGKVAAKNIIAEIQGGEAAKFEGHGFCFLDWADGTGSYVRGDFFAEPKPQVEVSPPDEKTIRAKEAFELERLDAWL